MAKKDKKKSKKEKDNAGTDVRSGPCARRSSGPFQGTAESAQSTRTRAQDLVEDGRRAPPAALREMLERACACPLEDLQAPARRDRRARPPAAVAALESHGRSRTARATASRSHHARATAPSRATARALDREEAGRRGSRQRPPRRPSQRRRASRAALHGPRASRARTAREVALRRTTPQARPASPAAPTKPLGLLMADGRRSSSPPAEFRTVIDRVFAMMGEDPEMGPALRDADVPQRFEFEDLDLVVNIRAARRGRSGNLHWEWSDDVDWEPQGAR